MADKKGFGVVEYGKEARDSRDVERDVTFAADEDGGGAPRVGVLLDELSSAINGASLWAQRAQVAGDSRWCLWPGQTEDGLKHAGPDEDPPFPWENASDTRIRLVDEKVRESTMTCMAAFQRGRLNVRGSTVRNVREAQRATSLLQWMLHTQMRPMAWRERKLFADWRNSYGVALMYVDWEMGVAMELEELDLMGLAEVFGLGDAVRMLAEDGVDPVAFVSGPRPADPDLAVIWDELENAWDLARNPEREGELVETLKVLFPLVKRRKLRAAARELRENGRVKLPQPYVIRNRPVWKALLPFENVFFPANTTSIEDAPWVALREWLTKGEVLERAASRGWDQSFVNALMNHEAASSTDQLERVRVENSRWARGRGAWESGVEDRRGLFEIFTFFHRSTNDWGVPGLYRTVTSMHVRRGSPRTDRGSQRGLFAEHELDERRHGKMPFVQGLFYQDSERLLENAGLAYMLYTYQNEAKTQRDYRIDASSISILPPLRRHNRDRKRPVRMGPDMPVYESVRGSTEWMQPPNSRPGMAVEVEQAVKRDADRLAGGWNAEIPQPVVLLHTEDLASSFLEEMESVLSLTWQLMQQFMDDVTVWQVSGPLGPSFPMSRDEIQGEFLWRISFDAKEMDPQLAQEKARLLTEIAQHDVGGVMDQNQKIAILLNLVDSHWADQLLTDPEQAQQIEVEDEQKNVGLIMAGVEPPMKEEGQNHRLRLQVLGQYLDGQTSPVVSEAVQRNEFIRGLFENRVKHLQHMVEQKEVNAPIGRVGARQVQQ